LDNRFNEAGAAPFLTGADISVDEIVENRAASAAMRGGFAILGALR
jgi:hypothetical protein